MWCDISYNSFNHQAARTLARSLKRNTVMTHIDISLCKFTINDIKVIGTALKSNRVLRGLHALGNEGTSETLEDSDSKEEACSYTETSPHKQNDAFSREGMRKQWPSAQRTSHWFILLAMWAMAVTYILLESWEE